MDSKKVSDCTTSSSGFSCGIICEQCHNWKKISPGKLIFLIYWLLIEKSNVRNQKDNSVVKMKRSFLTILLSKARSSHEVTYVMDDFIIADESMIHTTNACSICATISMINGNLPAKEVLRSHDEAFCSVSEHLLYCENFVQ